MHFLKLFRVSQLTVEYLLHVQNYLATSLHERDTKVGELSARVAELQTASDEAREQTATLKRDLKYYRKLAHAYEQMHGPLAAENRAALMQQGTPGPAGAADANAIASQMFSPIVDREGRTVYVRPPKKMALSSFG